jgi:hypothetical protein
MSRPAARFESRRNGWPGPFEGCSGSMITAGAAVANNTPLA